MYNKLLKIQQKWEPRKVKIPIKTQNYNIRSILYSLFTRHFYLLKYALNIYPFFLSFPFPPFLFLFFSFLFFSFLFHPFPKAMKSFPRGRGERRVRNFILNIPLIWEKMIFLSIMIMQKFIWQVYFPGRDVVRWICRGLRSWPWEGTCWGCGQGRAGCRGSPRLRCTGQRFPK